MSDTIPEGRRLVVREEPTPLWVRAGAHMTATASGTGATGAIGSAVSGGLSIEALKVFGSSILAMDPGVLTILAFGAGGTAALNYAAHRFFAGHKP